jgi:hypothetical protein
VAQGHLDRANERVREEESAIAEQQASQRWVAEKGGDQVKYLTGAEIRSLAVRRVQAVHEKRNRESLHTMAGQGANYSLKDLEL